MFDHLSLSSSKNDKCFQTEAVEKIKTQKPTLTLVDFQLDAQNSYLFTYNTKVGTLIAATLL